MQYILTKTMYYDTLSELIDSISPFFHAVVPVHKSDVSKNTNAEPFFPHLGILGHTANGQTLGFKHDSYTHINYDNCSKYFGSLDYFNPDDAQYTMVRLSSEEAESNFDKSKFHPFDARVDYVNTCREIATSVFDNIAFVKWHKVVSYGTPEQIDNWIKLPGYDILIGNRVVKEYTEFTRKSSSMSFVSLPNEEDYDETEKSLLAVYPGDYWICMLMLHKGKLKPEVLNRPFNDDIW